MRQVHGAVLDTMAIYVNQKPYRAIQSIEFSAVAGGNMAFVQFKDETGKDELKNWLRQHATGYEVVAETKVHGKSMLILRDGGNEQQLLHALSQHGDTFEPKRKDLSVDPWVVRSLLGFGGQSLQLASSFMRPKQFIGGQWVRKIDPNIFVFAAANLSANAINLIYRAQKQDDPHKLRYLKQQANDKLSCELRPGEKAPDVDDNRSKTRPETEEEKKSHAKTLDNFMRKYSVNVGELGLRYLGALGLAYDLQWSKLSKNPLPQLTESKFRRYAGLSSVAGKTVALASTIEDPYNPKPRSWWDNVREKFTFLLGGWIEVTSYTALAYENFFNTRPLSPGVAHPRGIQLAPGSPAYRDWLGGIGASMFVTGYIVRSWAKYGERRVNMNELYAHVSDTLAKLPPEKLPQLLADTAADIKEHFDGKQKVDYGTIYTQLLNDLEKFHHIVIKNGVATDTATGQETSPKTAAPATFAGVPETKVQGPVVQHYVTQEKEQALSTN